MGISDVLKKFLRPFPAAYPEGCRPPPKKERHNFHTAEEGTLGDVPPFTVLSVNYLPEQGTRSIPSSSLAQPAMDSRFRNPAR